VTYRIVMPTKVRTTLRAFPKALRQRIGAAMQLLHDDPFTPRPGCDLKLLLARGDGRLRVGDYRIFYYVDGEEIFVTVVQRKRSGTYD